MRERVPCPRPGWYPRPHVRGSFPGGLPWRGESRVCLAFAYVGSCSWRPHCQAREASVRPRSRALSLLAGPARRRPVPFLSADDTQIQVALPRWDGVWRGPTHVECLQSSWQAGLSPPSVLSEEAVLCLSSFSLGVSFSSLPSLPSEVPERPWGPARLGGSTASLPTPLALSQPTSVCCSHP